MAVYITYRIFGARRPSRFHGGHDARHDVVNKKNNRGGNEKYYTIIHRVKSINS